MHNALRTARRHKIMGRTDINSYLTDTNTSSAAAQALQLLITAAQAGDNGALLKLCSDFKPLLSSEARREMFYNSLGKDAEGIAVLAFIELVLKYSGTDYVNWPGYRAAEYISLCSTPCRSRAGSGKTRSPSILTARKAPPFWMRPGYSRGCRTILPNCCCHWKYGRL